MQHTPIYSAPKDCFLRLPDIKQATGLSRSTLYELMKLSSDEGGFPRPFKVHRISVWSQQEVQLWIEGRKAMRDVA